MIHNMPKVCIIGGGSSGMVASKIFQDEGIPFDCFETSDQIGGNWVFKNKNGMSSAYRSLHINTSKRQMEFKCFPMPDDYPDFPHHSRIKEYFDDFVDTFDLKKRITLNTTVVNAEKLESGRWEIELDNGTKNTYDALVVANGHHWDPQMPEPGFPGHFDGEVIHSHHYIDPTDPLDFKGKNVCIVGMGNSAMDIACELGHPGNANKVFLSVRRGTHILPKYFGGKPLDIFLRHPGDKPAFFESFIPAKAFEKIGFWYVHQRVKRIVGEPDQFGLPKVKHSFGQTHPTISDEIHIRLGNGDVVPKPNISRLEGGKVTFDDGSQEDIDILIYATGYKISFPFFKTPYVNAKSNDIALYKRMVSPESPNLMFLGLIQPLCSIMPIAEIQAEWMAKYLKGSYHLPDSQTMAATVKREHEEMKSRYVASKRHTIQINCQEYTYDLRQDLKAGLKRGSLAQGKPQIMIASDSQQDEHRAGSEQYA
ncbi:MAG: NAD(P)-binding domain-containing protein [Pseudobacteriovorax sp.]|nr:NAD(P)-binding domain-containing protein [Pseudobacteriovorax sp.]